MSLGSDTFTSLKPRCLVRTSSFPIFPAGRASNGAPLGAVPTPRALPGCLRRSKSRVSGSKSCGHRRPVARVSTWRLELHATPDLLPWKSVTLVAPDGQQIGAELLADANNLSVADVYPVAAIAPSRGAVFRRLVALGLPPEEQRVVIPTPADLPGATISFRW